MLHKLPISPHIRHELARVVLWSPGSSQIAIDDALLGGQNGLSAAEYAAATGDLFWPSRRVVDGPHAELLRRSRDAGELSDEEILDSPYGQMAARFLTCPGSTSRPPTLPESSRSPVTLSIELSPMIPELRLRARVSREQERPSSLRR